MLLEILIEKKLLEHFTKKNCKKQFKKAIERTGDKLYVKWKGYDKRYSLINQKDINI